MANLEIQKFTNDGKFITIVTSNTSREGEYRDLIIKENTTRSIFRSHVTRDGEFLDPHWIDVDTYGNMYVADAATLNVLKFTNDGKFITKWGSNGTNIKEFNGPEGIVVDPNGNIYEADAGNDRIQKFSLGTPK